MHSVTDTPGAADVTVPESDLPTWVARYRDEYSTLEEVGNELGITKEAVRLRLRGLGIAPRPLTDTIRLRARRETAIHADALRRAFYETRSLEETAELRAPRNSTKKYSEGDLVASLREAAGTASGNLTAANYAMYVARNPQLPDGRPRPGKQVMALRYGSWRGALEAAELPVDPPAGPQKEFDEADAVRAVVECWRAVGRPPTAARYDEWQRAHGGLPSGAAVRKLTGSWNTLLVRAWQVVHGVTLDQDEEDVAVPGSLLAEGVAPVDDSFVPYCAADEGTEISLRSDLVTSDYTALERAVRSHALLQNAVAEAAAAAGLRPWSPAARGPQFDVALSDDEEHVFIVEVKSATPENLEFQLRIGLGQVLRYAHQARSSIPTVIPVIAVERRPDDQWMALLEGLGVGVLVSSSIPEDLSTLLGKVEADSATG